MININCGNYVSGNILSKEEILSLMITLKKQGKKIGLCTGSFDLLHQGHIAHLNSAKKMCDILFVAIAKDSYSMNKHPGSNRPIFPEQIRAFMVSQLKPVDYVVFDNCNRLLSDDIIDLIKPDVYIKGDDYNLHTLSPIDIKKVESYGGQVVFTNDEKLSTSEIIKYIQEEIK